MLYKTRQQLPAPVNPAHISSANVDRIGQLQLVNQVFYGATQRVKAILGRPVVER